MLRSTQRWWRRPLQTLEECQARYGDMFTYRLAHEGTWVFLSDPEAIKQVFTGDPRLLHAGEANIVLLPVLGRALGPAPRRAGAHGGSAS